MKIPGVFVFVALLASWLLAPCGVAADENCSSCDQPAFPEAAAFLAEKGYPAEQYTVLLSWQEVAPGGDRRVVTGYHVLATYGAEAFDLYSDSTGDLLDVEALKILGIRAKKWDLPPIEQQSEFPLELKKSLPARPVPMGLKGKMPVSIGLPPLNLGALLDEDALDASTPRKGVQRVGIVRSLPETVAVIGTQEPSAGSWQTLDDGSRLWSVTLESPDARAIRVHFAALHLPPGGQVIVYNTDNPAEAYGPYIRPYGGEPDLWSASCFSDIVTVECRLPAEADLNDLKLLIDDVVHTYADFGLLTWTKAAGSCNLDVTCYSEWAATARGIGGFTFISTPSQVHCTGTLIADTDPGSRIPYFLTANHCVSAQDGSSGASSMEFFWLYQTSICNGTPPLMSTVPRTSDGADFLAGISSATGSDFALVRLRSAPPEDLTYVGWTSEPVSVGSSVTVIHHPLGEYKRISFGTTTNTGSPLNGYKPVKPYSDFTEVHWNQGTTEPASSGSPLLLTDTQVIVGQLWGGYAACSKPEEPDYFGRFDKTFAVLEPWLAPVIDPMDVNRSGSVDSADVQLVVNAALGIPIQYNADVDGSGAVDAVDVQLVIIALLKGIAA